MKLLVKCLILLAEILLQTLSIVWSLEIANTSLTSRMSTPHLIAILTQIATKQKKLKCFSCTLPSASFGTHSYPSLEDLDTRIAKKLTDMVRQGEVKINY